MERHRTPVLRALRRCSSAVAVMPAIGALRVASLRRRLGLRVHGNKTLRRADHGISVKSNRDLGHARRASSRRAGPRDALTGVSVSFAFSRWSSYAPFGFCHPTTARSCGLWRLESVPACSPSRYSGFPGIECPASLSIVSPGILAAAIVATANLEGTITASYVGFLTLSFIYIGITQSRLIPILAMPIAVPIISCAKSM